MPHEYSACFPRRRAARTSCQSPAPYRKTCFSSQTSSALFPLDYAPAQLNRNTLMDWNAKMRKKLISCKLRSVCSNVPKLATDWQSIRIRFVRLHISGTSSRVAACNTRNYDNDGKKIELRSFVGSRKVMLCAYRRRGMHSERRAVDTTHFYGQNMRDFICHWRVGLTAAKAA